VLQRLIQRRLTALQNNAGFTLVEVMIALLVLLFVTLAMMQTALVSIDSNMKNVLRDEAVRIAEQTMNDARSQGYDNLPSGLQTVNRKFRALDVTYTITRTVTQLGTADKQFDVEVDWTWKNDSYKQNISTLMRQQ